MNTLKSGVLAVALAAAAGCATVDYSSPGMLDGITVKGVDGKQAQQQVVINTIGYYVLWTIPLVSGDLRWDSETQDIKGGFSLFSDQVGVNELQTALLKIAESRDCDLADVHFSDSDTTFVGVSDLGGLIGALFGSSQMGVSALLVPRNQGK